jgi:orotate phosphoribosyltransferase
MNDVASFTKQLYQIGAIQFGEFKLKSGQMSSVYMNLRKIISYPDLLRSIADAMWEKTKACSYDLVCGVPYTALPMATCLSLQHNVPMIMRRKEKKDYGTKQSIEGVFKPQQTCLVIEDVITSGASILETTADLEAAELVVKDVVAFVDREQGGNETLSKKYRVHTIVTLSQILKTLLASSFIDATERKLIEKFLTEKEAK